MNDSERTIFDRAAANVAGLGAFVRCFTDLPEIGRPRWFEAGHGTYNIHHRPEPVRRRPKREYRAPAGRGR